jgi:hypothetical protein
VKKLSPFEKVNVVILSLMISTRIFLKLKKRFFSRGAPSEWYCHHHNNKQRATEARRL